MDDFFSVFPNGKPASCLEDLKKFSVKELLGKKQTFWWGPLPFFVVNNQSHSLNNCHQIHLWIIQLVALIKLFFSRQLSNPIWKSDIREIPNFNFSNTIILLLLRNKWWFVTKNFLWKTEIVPVFYEGHIKTMEICTTELFIYVHSKVKTFNKKLML